MGAGKIKFSVQIKSSPWIKRFLQSLPVPLLTFVNQVSMLHCRHSFYFCQQRNFVENVIKCFFQGSQKAVCLQVVFGLFFGTNGFLSNLRFHSALLSCNCPKHAKAILVKMLKNRFQCQLRTTSFTWHAPATLFVQAEVQEGMIPDMRHELSKYLAVHLVQSYPILHLEQSSTLYSFEHYLIHFKQFIASSCSRGMVLQFPTVFYNLYNVHLDLTLFSNQHECFHAMESLCWRYTQLNSESIILLPASIAIFRKLIFIIYCTFRMCFIVKNIIRTESFSTSDELQLQLVSDLWTSSSFNSSSITDFGTSYFSKLRSLHLLKDPTKYLFLLGLLLFALYMYSSTPQVPNSPDNVFHCMLYHSSACGTIKVFDHIHCTRFVKQFDSESFHVFKRECGTIDLSTASLLHSYCH